MKSMNPMALPERPITLLIAALGGEGGGVLADWIVAAATAQDYPVQSTSIPGVAQRTGATTYYIEIYQAKTSGLGGRRPVMTLTPAPGLVDVMVASELLEAGRAMQNGYVTERTTLVASTHRVYTVAEKMQMGDGRFDGEVVLKAGRELAKRAILFDMQVKANAAGTVISAVMFGALAGSGTLPLSREDCEASIRSGGKGAEASLKGFAAGFDAAAGGKADMTPEEGRRLRGSPAERLRPIFPEETHAILREGVARCADFQGREYANVYLDRIEPIANLDRAADGYKLTIETGRFLALWMCYEDVIRVADAAMTGLANKLNVGMHVKTTSVSGFLMMRFLAWLRPLRPLTARWHEEQALIGRWLAAIVGAAKRDAGLALEIALCGRLIKGYGETHKRGKGNFLRILDSLVEGGAVADPQARAEAIRKARAAALADPEGRKLEQSLESHGVAPLPPMPKPVRFMRRKPDDRKAA